MGLFYYHSPCLPSNPSERTLFWRDRRHICLSVSVRIPPVDMARNPWPRSLVGLETQLCFSSAPNDKEQFSAIKAVPGMTPALVQELLLNADRPIAAVGLIPAGTQYAAEYQRHGMKGFVTTPLDPVQVQNLPKLVIEAVRLAQAERQARSFTPVTAEDALAILDRGGWQQQTIAVFSPKGGVGKTTLSAREAWQRRWV